MYLVSGISPKSVTFYEFTITINDCGSVVHSPAQHTDSRFFLHSEESKAETAEGDPWVELTQSNSVSS